MSLGGSRGVEEYVVQVPMPQVDHVRIWWRSSGGEWRMAEAGDRVPLSRWPFANPFPAFLLSVGVEPIDVVLAVENDAFLRAPVTLLPDSEFRENLVRRASLSGVMMGLGAMVAIVCVLGAIGYGGRSRWMLAGVSLWTLFGIVAANGYLTVWFTGEWPAFNDWSRSFAGIVLAGLMLLLCTEALDALHVRRFERLLALAAPVVALVYAIVQVAWLPTPWRVPAIVVASAISVLGSAALCAVNHLRGGRHAGWVAGAIASMAIAPFVAFAAPDQVANLDLRAAVLAASLYVALLFIRQALMLRDRYGRDVLGRAATAANRDPLTALWSYDGFQQRHAEAALREAAGQGTSSVILFALPGLDNAAIQYGSAATERALVRFAATLQGLLGQKWAVARVSRTRFAAISLRPLTPIELADCATQVLAHCSRIAQPLNLVSDFDLRMACSRRRIADTPMPELLRELKQAALALDYRKRIVYLQPMPAAALAETPVTAS
nr:7TM-DISM domain-containing protein [Ramlibacter albus]